MKVSISNTYLAYDDHGIGIPVLLLHAFPLNRGMWQGEVTGLLKDGRYRLGALGLRGGWGSGNSNAFFSRGTCAGGAAVVCVLDGGFTITRWGLLSGGWWAVLVLPVMVPAP